MFEWMVSPEIWIAFFTLTALEVVLGIDNIVFISIMAGKLPPEQRPKARFIGLSLALVMRILLLMTLAWMMKLSAPLFEVLGKGFSGKDLILLGGGLFLLAKSTVELHAKVEGADRPHKVIAAGTFVSVILQILVIDVVFSVDSIITAVGMTDVIGIMVAAVITAVIFMMIFAGPVGDFVDRHPTIKVLALGFLLLIGSMLVAEGLGHHIPKGYIYFAMAFSLGIEMINLRVRGGAGLPVEPDTVVDEGAETDSTTRLEDPSEQ